MADNAGPRHAPGVVLDTDPQSPGSTAIFVYGSTQNDTFSFTRRANGTTLLKTTGPPQTGSNDGAPSELAGTGGHD